MPQPTNAAELVDRWRSDSSVDSPAGPLFSAGAFAICDIICETGGSVSTQKPSACTGSFTVHCC
jgi:hypothetical protein